jgi:hypothetical protein
MKKIISRAVILGLVGGTVLAVGCSNGASNQGTAPALGGRQDATGTVGAQLTLPSGALINTVNYTLTNGTNTLSGSVNVAAATSISFVIPNVPVGTGYTVTLTAVSTDGSVSCAGSSGTFNVLARQTTNVNVQLVCTSSGGGDAGSVVVNGSLDFCATWNTIVALPSTASTGGSVSLTAAGSAPTPASLTFAWSAPSGTISGATQSGTTDTATFTCPATPGVVTVTVVLSDGALPDGGSCPAADTTATVNVTCGAPAEAGAPEGGADGGGSGDAAKESGSDTAGPLVPCTTAGQTGCVQCNGNASGLCSATESQFVALDIKNGLATSGGFGATSCYECLFNAGCIDDTVFGDSNHECGDLTGTLDGGSDSTLCLSTISCIISTSCVDSAGVSTCYCGTTHEGSACASAGGAVNGACLTQEVNGLGYPASDNTDILKNFTSTALPSGMANQLFQCASSNSCSTCL